MKAKLVACNVPTKNHRTSVNFYQTLFGLEFARSFSTEVESHHIPLTNEGQWFWISNRTATDEQISCVFAVDNLDAALAELTKAGGKIFVQPFTAPIAEQAIDFYAANRGTVRGNVTGNMGRLALLRDPDGNVIALLQPETHAQSIFKVGPFAIPLSAELLESHERTREAGKALL
jgi:predicted enzyme related to lactoylglutathione lyase